MFIPVWLIAVILTFLVIGWAVDKARKETRPYSFGHLITTLLAVIWTIAIWFLYTIVYLIQN